MCRPHRTPMYDHLRHLCKEVIFLWKGRSGWHVRDTVPVPYHRREQAEAHMRVARCMSGFPHKLHFICASAAPWHLRVQQPDSMTPGLSGQGSGPQGPTSYRAPAVQNCAGPMPINYIVHVTGVRLGLLVTIAKQLAAAVTVYVSSLSCHCSTPCHACHQQRTHPARYRSMCPAVRDPRSPSQPWA